MNNAIIASHFYCQLRFVRNRFPALSTGYISKLCSVLICLSDFVCFDCRQNYFLWAQFRNISTLILTSYFVALYTCSLSGHIKERRCLNFSAKIPAAVCSVDQVSTYKPNFDTRCNLRLRGNFQKYHDTLSLSSKTLHKH